MDIIDKTFTVQWVGPFHSLEELNCFKWNDNTNSLDCFNLYCFEARYRSNSKWRRYLGIHQNNDGIDKRLNERHEHFRQFISFKEKNIWIGAFGSEVDQTPENIDIVETLFVRTYRQELTENDKKKKSHTHAYGEFSNVFLCDDEFEKLQKSFQREKLLVTLNASRLYCI